MVLVISQALVVVTSRFGDLSLCDCAAPHYHGTFTSYSCCNQLWACAYASTGNMTAVLRISDMAVLGPSLFSKRGQTLAALLLLTSGTSKKRLCCPEPADHWQVCLI